MSAKVFFKIVSTLSRFTIKDTYMRTLCTGHGPRTVYALSSGQGKCGVAVIRVSGPQAFHALSKMCGKKRPIQPRQAHLRTLKDPLTKEVLDRAIVLWFPGPHSFTGEDSCEFQIHGGLAVINGVLQALGKIPGLNPADPGEFSKRAFYNGKLDLTEAEGLADLIHAETEMQRKQALLQVDGSLHGLYNKWREILLQNMAHVEAYIDFSEDDNIEDDVMDKVNLSVTELHGFIKLHLADGRRGERLRSGVQTVIVGEPNVGKSSLLNALCQKPAAIVTPIAGTTRDIVEQCINFGGYPLSLADTAGLRSTLSTSDPIEQEGIARARVFAQAADLVLLVVDSQQFLQSLCSRFSSSIDSFQQFLQEYVSKLGLQENNLPGKLLHQSSNQSEHTLVQCMVLLNKSDLVSDPIMKQQLNELEIYSNVSVLSCVTEEGFRSFSVKLQNVLQELCGRPSRENPVLSQTRHRHHLNDCLHCLNTFMTLSRDYRSSGADLVICAEELRKSLRHLGKITGQVSTDQVLDVIFRDFCIGK